MLRAQTKKITAFLSVVAMVLSMLLYFPSGTFGDIDIGLKASAEGTTTDFTLSAVIGNPKGISNEDYTKLFDNNTGTKWCCNFSGSAYVIFKASEPVKVSKYSIATAGDTNSFSNRNPQNWTLSACKNYPDATTSWTVIDTVTGGGLPTANETYTDFTLAEATPYYQYFKLEITSIIGGDILQIGEIALKDYTLCAHQWEATGETIAPTCTEDGCYVEYCSLCQGTRNVPTEDALGHSFVDEVCTRCGVADTTPMEPSTRNDGTYQIGTAAELYWFAGLVNGTLDGVEKNIYANAELTADITVNSNLLGSLAYDVDGDVTNGTSFISWTPIGNSWGNFYYGTFDGQNHTISGLYFNDSGASYVGLFGCIYSGTVKNVGVLNSYFKGYIDVGGVCGLNDGTIASCYNTGTVNGISRVGGVCGYGWGSTIGCFSTGSVNGTEQVGGVCGLLDDYPIANCYFDSDQYGGNAIGAINSNYDDTVTDVEGKTTAQFRSGEVAYRLSQSYTVGRDTYDGSVWGQTIGTDNYPVLGGKKVYATTGCVTYNNDGNTNAKEHNYTFTADAHSCSDCGFTESHTLGKNNQCTVCKTYAIANADQLYWFADQVKNNHTSFKNANAVLTADITVNTGVLQSDGTLADDTSSFRSWTPIGYSDLRIYTGIFDGQGHTISGLYVNDASESFVGLFGCAGTSSSVSNVGVVDSYFNGNNNVGGVCGYSNGKITNCYNQATVNGSGYVGGVCGEAGPGSTSKITNCYNVGIVKGKTYTACVVGYADSGKVSNCYYSGEQPEEDLPILTQPVIPIDPSITLTTTTTKPKITVPRLTTTTTTTTTREMPGIVIPSLTTTSTSSQIPTVPTQATTDGLATPKTPEQFASGEVAYLLAEGDNGSVWGQKIGTDAYPVLDGTKKVYQIDVYAGCKGNPGTASKGYSNTNAPVYAVHNMTEHTANAASCTNSGNYAYWTCSHENGVYYKDEAGTETFANFAATVIPAHGHDMTEHPANAATCTNPGNYAYWTCSREDGVYYKDEAGTDTFENLEVTAIPAFEHDYTSAGICKICAALENGKDGFKSVSLTLTDGVLLNYYLLLSEEALADTGAYIHFTSAQGLDVIIMLSEGTEDNGKYKFSLALRPDQMTEVITAQVVYSDGSTGNSVNYSVQQYGENVTEADSSKALVDAMLKYGAYTQLYTGENTDNLAVSVGDYTVNASIDESYQYTLDSNAAGISLTGATLQIGAYTTIRLKFQLEEGADIDNYTFQCGDTVLTPEKSGAFYYVYLRNIRPQDLDEMYSFTVSDGTNTITFTYSAFTYMKNVLDNADAYDQTLVNLINAMYDYHQAAEAYLIG